jgi:hypothetical protein
MQIKRRERRKSEKTTQDGGNPADGRTAPEIEEHILRCLGAALIMQWNAIPPKLQRELFDTAGSLGDLLKSATRANCAFPTQSQGRRNRSDHLAIQTLATP